MYLYNQTDEQTPENPEINPETVDSIGRPKSGKPVAGSGEITDPVG